MAVLTGVFVAAIVAVVLWTVVYAFTASSRERVEAKREIAERTGPQRIIPAYPDDRPGPVLHGGAHRRGGRRG